MHIVLFTHPDFLDSQSMPLFARMIYQGMIAHGHEVECWKPEPVFFRLPIPKAAKKWLGYIDQFILFPLQVRKRLRQMPADTLFIFTDQALGPWVPLVKNRPHVIHCHDFMALRSALDHYPQNPVSWSGKLYQVLIRWGFSQGSYFISVSDKTRKDLHCFLPKSPKLSETIYNGLNYAFVPMPEQEARALFAKQGLQLPSTGFLLHVGGNQWYKNRAGVLYIYHTYCQITNYPLPLFLLGAEPNTVLCTLADDIPQNGKIVFLTDVSTQVIQAAYSLAAALIFPSIAEGFGWPIAEAMACGCPVLTTDKIPMTEVGGDAAVYISAMPSGEGLLQWRQESAQVLVDLLNEDADKQAVRRQMGFTRIACMFSTELALTNYERVYTEVLRKYS